MPPRRIRARLFKVLERDGIIGRTGLGLCAGGRRGVRAAVRIFRQKRGIFFVAGWAVFPRVGAAARRFFVRAGGGFLFVLEEALGPADRFLTRVSGGLDGLVYRSGKVFRRAVRGALAGVRVFWKKCAVSFAAGWGVFARVGAAARRFFARAGGGFVFVLGGAFGPVDRFLTWVSGGLDGLVYRSGKVFRRAVRGALAAIRRGLVWTGTGRLREGVPRIRGLARLAAVPLAYRVVGAVVALALIIVPYELVWAKNAVAVTAGGRVVAQASGIDAVWAAVRQVEAREEGRLGLPVEVMGSIGVTPIHSDGPVLAGEALRVRLADSLPFGVDAAGISVDGRVRVVVRDAATAGRTLRDLTAGYRAAGAAVHFQNAVAVVPVTVPPGQVVSERRALSVLDAKVVRPATYTVHKGDTLWQLARAFHTTVDRLVADNPGLDGSHLAVGEVLELAMERRTINVVATFRSTYDEELPYPVRRKDDGRLAYGDEKVLQAGRDGEEQVVAVVTMENGVTTGRRVVGKQVLRPPVPEIEAFGGGLMVASRGGDYHGILQWPASGPITSPFGWRHIFGHQEFHEGIDIGAAYGSPVVAAAAGVVTFSGWESGYGHMVEVDHGHGLSTLYAHLSLSLVKVGERVGQGQDLGHVGETGDATGPNLHFEVHVDGTPVNPLRFL